MTDLSTGNNAPVIIVGSGFHRWLRGETGDDALSSWRSLLVAIAKELRVALPSSLSQSMSLAWEELLLRMVREGYSRPGSGVWAPPRSAAVGDVEADARRAARNVLLSFHSHGIPQWGRSRRFHELPVSNIISLNFDLAWTDPGALKFKRQFRAPGEVARTGVGANEFNRLYSRVVLPNGFRVWFPNGSALAGGPKIRLGLRDFGLQMHALQYAFGTFRAWQSNVTNGNFLRGNRDASAILLNHLALGTGEGFEIADHWVTRFMLYPLYFIGAGLSSEEQGMWWLLVQRARNLARVNAGSQARILLSSRHASAEEKKFWSRDTAIIQPVLCDDWDSGWETVFQMIREDVSPALS